MKHRSIWVAALLLGGTPLCAMALDYGPTSPLLAAETGARQAPGADAGGAAGNDTARPEVAASEADADDDTTDAAQPAAPSGSQRMTPSGASPQPSAARGPAPTASSKSRMPATTAPAAAPTATSWQSLLPGSIQ